MRKKWNTDPLKSSASQAHGSRLPENKPEPRSTSAYRICELCRRVVLNDADHQRHFSTVHAGWVDRLVIAMCLQHMS